jgi:hypothetical protein
MQGGERIVTDFQPTGARMTDNQIPFLGVTALMRNALALKHDIPPEFRENLLVYINAGEPQLAFEVFCEHIFEYDLPLTQGDRDRINVLAAHLDSESYARDLDFNPSGDHG